MGCFGGAAEELVRELDDFPDPLFSNLIEELSNLVPPSQRNWKKLLANSITKALQVFPKLLIIHGRSSDRKEMHKLFKMAKAKFPNLPKPIIIGEKADGAPALPDLFESWATRVDAAIALITPDDIGTSVVHPNGKPKFAVDLLNLSQRARENVWVEVGWFWGHLGTDRIMILSRGTDIKVPSDLQSLVYHSYENSPTECVKEVFTFIESMRKRGTTSLKKGRPRRKR